MFNHCTTGFFISNKIYYDKFGVILLENQIISEEIRSKEAKKITLIGFVVNAILTGFKIFAGVTGNSSAMIADGVHSLSDFFTDIIVLVGFKITDKPEDESHNYGHGKFETLATAIISFALFFAGYKILISGLNNIYGALFKNILIEKPSIVPLIAAIISIISKELLYRYTKLVGERIKSSAVIANGWHHRSDAFSSVGTLIGIGGAFLLGSKWTILDPIASIIVSIFIFRVAFQILLPSVNELMEASLQKDEILFIEKIIKTSPSIVNYHHLRTRRIGNKIAVEVHLIFDRNIMLYEAHEHATTIEKQIKDKFGSNSIITTHLETN